MIALRLFLGLLALFVSLAVAFPGGRDVFPRTVGDALPQPSPEPAAALEAIAQLRRPGYRRFLESDFASPGINNIAAGNNGFETLPVNPGPGFRPVSIITRTLDSSMKFSLANDKLPRVFHHWAVLVGGNCYELNHGVKSGEDYNMYVYSLAAWKIRQGPKNANQYFEIPVGYTKWTDEDISKCAKEIWEDVFKGEYESQYQNCQEFAIWLLRCICHSLNEVNMATNLHKRFAEVHPRLVLMKILPYSMIVGLGAYFVLDDEGNFKLLKRTGLVIGAGSLLYAMYQEHKDHERWEDAAELESEWRKKMGYSGEVRTDTGEPWDKAGGYIKNVLKAFGENLIDAST